MVTGIIPDHALAPGWRVECSNVAGGGVVDGEGALISHGQLDPPHWNGPPLGYGLRGTDNGEEALQAEEIGNLPRRARVGSSSPLSPVMSAAAPPCRRRPITTARSMSGAPALILRSGSCTHRCFTVLATACRRRCRGDVVIANAGSGDGADVDAADVPMMNTLHRRLPAQNARGHVRPPRRSFLLAPARRVRTDLHPGRRVRVHVHHREGIAPRVMRPEPRDVAAARRHGHPVRIGGPAFRYRRRRSRDDASLRANASPLPGERYRSTQRRVPRGRDDEDRLVADMVELARRYGRYGYQRIAALLRDAGWRVNDKRVEPLWQRARFRTSPNP